MIHSEVTYKNTLILTSLPSIFSAVKLLFWRKNCARVSLLQALLIENLVWLCCLKNSEQPVHTTSFMERFSLTQVCIFSAIGYCRKLFSVWTCPLGSASKNTAWIQWKLNGDILKTHWGKHFGCWFSLHSSQFLSLSSDNSEETPHLNHLTRGSSHTTLRFTCLVWLHNSTLKQFTPLPSTKGCLTQVGTFSAETLQGNLLGVILAIGLCLEKLWFHPVKARMCLSQTHLWKHFGCLRKHFHYHQFWSLAHDISEETLYLDILTRTCSHGTPRFITHSTARPLMTQRSASSHHFLHGKIQCVPSE